MINWRIWKFEYLFAKSISKIADWINDTAMTGDNLRIMSKLKSCGIRVHFHGKITIVSPENIELNDNVIIGNNAYLDGRGGIKIGDNTHISRNFVVHSSSHQYQGTRLPFDEVYDLKPVIIGCNVWIGTNVVLVPGITIGDGAIIGAGAVVTKSVPPLAIVGNQPSRVIKYRDNKIGRAHV